MASKNSNLAVGLLAIVVGMGCLAYASVPLYSLFCKITGYGGTTVDATKLSKNITDRVVTIRFDANVNKALPWKFHSQQQSVEVHVGEQKLAFFTAKNLSDKPTVGTATYNVTPHKAGIYFNKVQCFCYERQPLEAGQKTDMPVSFFIDPDFVKDPEMADVDTITLSYSFFAVP